MKSTPVQSLVTTWLVGGITGTLLIALTSPLFVRSYAPLQADTVRRVWTLPAGQTYRWRSEGYANTSIGPHGMPGRTSLSGPKNTTGPPTKAGPPTKTGLDNKADAFAWGTRLALWGDSQAEGVCVTDQQKLFARIESQSDQRVAVLPLARSGEDAADWVTQIPLVEQPFQIDAHVLLIVDLPDLALAVNAPVPAPSTSDVSAANSALAARLPAFIIQAARHLLTESDDTTRRKLRFRIGPVAETSTPHLANAPVIEQQRDELDWRPPLRALRQSTDRPIVILYAPKVPQIIGDRMVASDPMAESFAAMKPVAESLDIRVIDARPLLLESALAGDWPHGFQNGQIGAGHLNACGNGLLASLLVDAMKQTNK